MTLTIKKANKYIGDVFNKLAKADKKFRFPRMNLDKMPNDLDTVSIVLYMTEKKSIFIWENASGEDIVTAREISLLPDAEKSEYPGSAQTWLSFIDKKKVLGMEPISVFAALMLTHFLPKPSDRYDILNDIQQDGESDS